MMNPNKFAQKIGSGLLAVLSTLRASIEARRVPMGNLIFKIFGCVLVLPLLVREVRKKRLGKV